MIRWASIYTAASVVLFALTLGLFAVWLAGKVFEQQ